MACMAGISGWWGEQAVGECGDRAGSGDFGECGIRGARRGAGRKAAVELPSGSGQGWDLGGTWKRGRAAEGWGAEGVMSDGRRTGKTAARAGDRIATWAGPFPFLICGWREKNMIFSTPNGREKKGESTRHRVQYVATVKH